ncbi:TerB family tellurite resistance protein [Aliiroseovarius sp. PrR006]|uniref:tellurite resistance TerB family protein n=1 Tax=Aliiroseovarius sp. PrR006 TaxID=2706883 RepID=UPI0013D101CA|nr:TerB family tellurite resistance protein [Aliiroseovarius sp. PrR006]NDW52682.1 TerB family tellurite resistance protein [Aliiroseovarius sp. PrR006]
MSQADNIRWTEDAQGAMGVLLVRLARADANYAQTEIARIDRLFAHHYDLNPVAAAKLRAECEAQEKQAGPTDDLARAVQGLMPMEQRVRIITALWQVSLADGVLRDEEADLVTRVAEASGVPRGDIVVE